MARRRPSPALIVAFLALLVSVSGVAFGTIPARDGDIHACYSKKTGDVDLVNTQRDSFGCPHNWRGLIIDTTPTSLTSPDGRFSVDVTNDGVSMSGPNTSVELTGSDVNVNGRKVTVTSATDIDMRAAAMDIVGTGIVHIKGSKVQTEQTSP
jgi:hypothetical protein